MANNPIDGLIASRYKTSQDLYDSSAEESENKAMELLQRAMSRSSEVTPTQGFAAALLAAIPTIGGYMIGARQKMPSMAPGTWAENWKDYQGMAQNVGPAAGLGQGATVGQAAGVGYLDTLEANQEQSNKVNTLLANEQLKQAQAAREAQLQIPRDVAERQAQFDSQSALQRQGFSNQMALEQIRDAREELPPEVMAALEKGEGLPQGTRLTAPQLRSYSNYQNSQRMQSQFDYMKSQKDIPGWEWTSVPDTKTVDAVKTKNAAFESYLGAAREMKDALAAAGRYAISPDSSQESNMALARVKAASARLMEAQKNKSGAGAALTPTEMMAYFGAIPAFLGNPMKGVRAAFIEQGLSLDPIQQMDQIIDQAEKQRADEFRGYGLVATSGAADTGQPQTRTVNGITYKKVPGGWLPQ